MDIPSNAKSQQRALVVTGPGTVEVKLDMVIPDSAADEVLVHVVYVALNPVDHKATELSPAIGAVIGCDFAGIVVELGRNVEKPFAVGDRVCGIVFGNNARRPNNGAFAESVAVHGDFLLKVPDDMSTASGASMGAGLATCGLALYQEMSLPRPIHAADPSPFVLVYGASTATGSLALQLIQLSGFRPVAVCSEKNFDLVRSRGAVEAFDYHDAACGLKVQAFTNDSLSYALDCITTSESMRICYEAIGSRGGKYVAFDQFPLRQHTRRAIKPRWILMNTMSGEAIAWQGAYKRDAKPEDRQFGKDWFLEVQRLLDGNKIKPHPLKVMNGGFESILEGLKDLKKGKLSAQKIVCRLRPDADV